MAKDRICSIPGCGKRHFARGWCRQHYYRWVRQGDPMVTKCAKNGDLLAFLEGLVGTEDQSCVRWPFNLSGPGEGYGQLRLGGKTKKAHNVMCRLAHGDHPPDKPEAAHLCGNSACVNPNHLEWKSHAENMADMVLHGRSNRGERSPMGKLTEHQVREIRSKLKDGVLPKDIAPQYGLHTVTVRDIRRGKLWGWLD